MPMWKPTFPSGDTRPVFRLIVQSLADDIAASRLPVGARLPPHRELADELGVARGTVARAYREAEALGLLRSEVGRGTHVLAPDGGDRPYSSLLEPPTVVSDLSTNLPLSGIDPDPADVLRRLADRPDRKSLLRYHPPLGIQRHRVAGAHWLARMGVEASAEDIALCAGAQHALFVILSHLGTKTRTLYVEELTYPGIHGIVEALSLTLVPVAMDAEGMSPSSLDAVCRRHGPGAVYCMPTIHNPTGAVMGHARRGTIAAVARARDLFIVEDAANRMLVPNPPLPLLSYAPERTFLVASVSKVLAPGLRVAFAVGPRSELGALARRIWATQWMVGPVGAEIVAMWLEDGVVVRTLKQKRKEAARRQAVAKRILGSPNLTSHPNALHMWLTLPMHWRSEKFAAEAARQSIVVTPSSAFWARATPPPRAIRIALGGVDDITQLESGLVTLAQIVRG